ncbi:tetratricopeptide repeat protein [Desulfolutivibrio sulfoxidireducens]|uniref:tetratricopeptide repeat protein n=1 Tax=Desulfolutivibrio sulfoxidireducens TaxID=2773299 RepID=UPI00159E51DE|nr:tetratricopeptide repeat protein [Desulfolutivibrio sulfoxidireducens]QLA15579.1 tetratricopeptide repeat protein [Desulfolutivibrio sulfoxidireducens]QLA19182.1 tetratricopeptide repeat protein [Desulfolutivibrio sulfoxidireducens]
MANPTKSPAASRPEAKPAHPAADHGLLAQLVMDYWKPAVAAAVLALAAAGSVALYQRYQASRIAEVTEKIGQIAASKDGAQRLTELKALLAEAPAGARDGVLFEMAKAAQDASDLPAAALAWEDLSTSSDAALRVVAELGRAAVLVSSGDTAKALEVLEKARQDAPKTFALAVDRQIAVTAEASGDFKRAIEGYERMVSEGAMQNKSFLESKIEALRAKVESTGQKSNG